MKTKELTSEELAVFESSFPVSDENNQLTLPRFGMRSKDLTEEKGTGKNKKITVVQAAGTFYTEKDLGETIEVGEGKNKKVKKVWTKEYLKDEDVDVIICFFRKQLKKFDSSLNKWISSSVFDTKDQVISLFLDKQVIKKGTQDFLQSCYPALSQKGKKTSDLKEFTILFIVHNGELHQMELSQSSKWAFKDYKKTLDPSKVMTTLGSVEDTFGTNTFRKTTFTNKRNVTQDEWDIVQEFQTLLKEKVESDASYFLANAETKQIDSGKALDEYGNEKME